MFIAGPQAQMYAGGDARAVFDRWIGFDLSQRHDIYLDRAVKMFFDDDRTWPVCGYQNGDRSGLTRFCFDWRSATPQNGIAPNDWRMTAAVASAMCTRGGGKLLVCRSVICAGRR